MDCCWKRITGSLSIIEADNTVLECITKVIAELIICMLHVSQKSTQRLLKFFTYLRIRDRKSAAVHINVQWELFARFQISRYEDPVL